MAEIEYESESLNKIKDIINECGIVEFYKELYKDLEKIEPIMANLFSSIYAVDYEIRHFLSQLSDEDSYLDEDENIKMPNNIEVIDKYMNYFAIRLSTLYKFLKEKNLKWKSISDVLKDNNYDNEDISLYILLGALLLFYIMAQDIGFYKLIDDKAYELGGLDIDKTTEYYNALLKVCTDAYLGQMFYNMGDVTSESLLEISKNSYLLKSLVKTLSKFNNEEIMYVIENQKIMNPFED